MSSDYEGLPLSILEAMAAGLPIISTNVGGVADIVTDNGILIPPKDGHRLANEMVKLVLNHKLRNAIRLEMQSNMTVRNLLHSMRVFI